MSVSVGPFEFLQTRSLLLDLLRVVGILDPDFELFAFVFLTSLDFIGLLVSWFDRVCKL